MAAEIDQAFERLYGTPCWDVHWDADTGLRLNFGEPHLHVREPQVRPAESPYRTHYMYRNVWVAGDWVLHHEGFWKLTLRDIPPVTGSSSYRRIMMGESRLDGQKLLSATVKPSTGATRLEFDIGAVLELRRYGRGDTDGIWDLRTPEGRYLVINGDGTYSLNDGNRVDPQRYPIAAGLRSNKRFHTDGAASVTDPE